LSAQQQGKKNIRIPDEEAATSSKAQLRSDNESMVVKGDKGKRWSDDEDNTELVAISPLDVRKVNGMVTTVKALPPLAKERWSNWLSRSRSGDGQRPGNDR
jgi:hypothetical protein